MHLPKPSPRRASGAERNRAVKRSTGALGTLVLPSHFISMAGANHGSSLAQTGKSWLGYIQKLWTHHILSVGKRVLTDLDYGSDFLIDLNKQWLIETVAPAALAAIGVSEGSGLANLFVFSMGGDSHGHDFGVDIFPPSAEPGSDNTVRISGANMNYSGLWPPRLNVGLPLSNFPHLKRLLTPNASNSRPNVAHEAASTPGLRKSARDLHHQRFGFGRPVRIINHELGMPAARGKQHLTGRSNREPYKPLSLQVDRYSR